MAKKKKRPKKNIAAVSLGRRGGRVKSPRQNAARKKNASYGGRPRRVCMHCAKPVLGGHVDRRQDERCGAHGWRWQQRDSPITRDVVEREIAELQSLLATIPEIEVVESAVEPTAAEPDPDVATNDDQPANDPPAN